MEDVEKFRCRIIPPSLFFYGRSAAFRRELLHESEVEERQADRSHEPTERVDHHQNFIGRLSREHRIHPNDSDGTNDHYCDDGRRQGITVTAH